MVEFKFSQFGTDFGTQDMGAKIRQQLRPLLNGNEVVVSLDDLKKCTTFRGLNPLAERSVLVALQRRYRVLQTQSA